MSLLNRCSAFVLRCGLLSLVALTIPAMANTNRALAEPLYRRLAQTLMAPEVVSELSPRETILAALADRDVVYLGETHDSAADHQAQLEIVQALHGQGEIAIALEMFQRPFQPVLDAYLVGELSEDELVAQSEYETRWGFDWAFYAPIVRYAKANQIPLIALNTPAEITRQVASEGLASLNGEDFRFIPPIDEIDLSDENYRALLEEVFNAHGGHGNSEGFENFFAAQVLWDETMAEGVVRQLEVEPDRQVVVLVGEAHVGYGYGIPNRVRRRRPEVKQASVAFADTDERVDPEFTDLFWRL